MNHTVCTTVKAKQPVKPKSATKAKPPAKTKNPKPTKSKKRGHPETENSQPPAKKAKVAKVHITRARKKSIYHSDFLNPVELSVEESAERKTNSAKFKEMFDSD